MTGSCAAVLDPARALVAIKLIHTVLWAFFAGCILLLPFAAVRRRFRLAATLSAVVLAECAILAVNGGHCPLTEIAARFTPARADNFDIYLPLWLARYNKLLFGALFTAGETLLLVCWFRSAAARSRRPG